ncbi:TRIC cation channel family protein, partial [Paraburkholderia ginsengiterrae]|uniref:TRIC cation channel family protein n=1 Tax=Paraburkholderia ginsengiterrae TaxID=1462993 RepID=UPI001ABEFF22
AISGLIEAKTRRLDAVGTFLVAIAPAFGCGTLRDVLLERRPFYWVQHPDYLIAIFVMSLFAPNVLQLPSRLPSDPLLLLAAGRASLTGASTRASLIPGAGLPPAGLAAIHALLPALAQRWFPYRAPLAMALHSSALVGCRAFCPVATPRPAPPCPRHPPLAPSSSSSYLLSAPPA